MATMIARPSSPFHVHSSVASKRSSLPWGSSFNPLHSVDNLQHDGFHQYRLISFTKQDQRKKLHMSVRCSSQPAPPPAPPSSSPFPGFPGRKGWIIGIALSFFLPFLKNQWAPLLMLKKEVDTTLERVEESVEVMEKVAEGVEKLAKEVEEELPDGQLKKAIATVEHAAEQAEATAHLVQDTVRRVEIMEEKIEARVEEELANRDRINGKTPTKTTKVEQA